MKKIIVYSTFLLYLLNSNNIYSNTDYKSKKIENDKNIVDFAKKTRLEKEIDNQLESLFSAIRKHNNKYVKAHLKLIESEKNNEEKFQGNLEGMYGPNPKDFTFDILYNIVKVDVNVMDKNGYTPIIVAIESKNNEILKLLLENGANIYEKHPVFEKLTLHTACYYENEEAVEILLEKNKELVNYRSGIDGWTPLQDATLKSNSNIVKILLKNGANPLIRDNNNGNAVNMATEFGKGEIVKLLRDNIKQKRQN